MGLLQMQSSAMHIANVVPDCAHGALLLCTLVCYLTLPICKSFHTRSSKARSLWEFVVEPLGDQLVVQKLVVCGPWTTCLLTNSFPWKGVWATSITQI